jgi:hypothetical protein
MSAKEVGKELFKDVFHSKKAGGNASNEDKPIVKGDIVVLDNPQNISTFAQFNAEFAKAVAPKGWASHEDRYIKLQQSTIKHYKLDKLPMG